MSSQVAPPIPPRRALSAVGCNAGISGMKLWKLPADMPALRQPALVRQLLRQPRQTGQPIASYSVSRGATTPNIGSPTRIPFTRPSFAIVQANSTSRFSTMSSLQSNESGSIGGARDYDHEIKDMASYIHNYKVDSDLAVCLLRKHAPMDPVLIVAV